MFWKSIEKGVLVNLKVITNSKKNEVVCESGDFLKVKIKAKPINNQANKTLVDFLSDFFNIPKTSIQIIKGEHSHFKTVLVGIDKNNFLSAINNP